MLRILLALVFLSSSRSDLKEKKREVANDKVYVPQGHLAILLPSFSIRIAVLVCIFSFTRKEKQILNIQE